MNDVRQWIYGAIIGLLACIGLMLGIVYVSACGLTLTCNQALPLVIRTPIPTLIPAAHAEEIGSDDTPEFNQCLVSAQDLVGAWVAADSPESEPFPFTDVHGKPCEGTFANDVQHLFMDNNVWFAGQLGCASCHNADLTDRSGGLDLSSYEGVLAGSNRSYEGASGTTILSDGDWESSPLHAVLVDQGFGPEGHSPEAEPIAPVFIYAGQHVEETAPTPTATP
jgi:hypothetical protein